VCDTNVIETADFRYLKTRPWISCCQLDAALEGELETVRKAVGELVDASRSNEDGITALHNAICAEHLAPI
jgi:hypothetical protein